SGRARASRALPGARRPLLSWGAARRMSNAGLTPRLNLTLPTPGLSDNVWGYELNDTINLLDQVVVSRDGDAMLGPFTLYQDPIGVLDAVPKRYVDARPFDMAHVPMGHYA